MATRISRSVGRTRRQAIYSYELALKQQIKSSITSLKQSRRRVSALLADLHDLDPETTKEIRAEYTKLRDQLSTTIEAHELAHKIAKELKAAHRHRVLVVTDINYKVCGSRCSMSSIAYYPDSARKTERVTQESYLIKRGELPPKDCNDFTL